MISMLALTSVIVEKCNLFAF